MFQSTESSGKVNSLLNRLNRFLTKTDTRQNPIKAIFKRIFWRVYWTFSSQPYVVSFAKILKIAIPQSGSGSLIYYQGFSEPRTADFFQRFLKPGMTFIDVGAHIGEYTLLAAKLVGNTGKVHGFEPQASLFPLLNKNIQINQFDRVKINQSALSDREGEVEFEIFDEPSVSSIRKPQGTDNKLKKSQIVKVPTTSLDSYCREQNLKVDFIKVDVEGAEKLVFEGAQTLMALPNSEAPVWIFEFAPKAYTLFNYKTQDLLNLLDRHNYRVYEYLGDGKVIDFAPNKVYRGIVNLIATKDKDFLVSKLA